MEEIAKHLAILADKNPPPLRIKEFLFRTVPLLSYNIQEFAYKQLGLLPIQARGLFLEKYSKNIVIRGYDKFFNGFFQLF